MQKKIAIVLTLAFLLTAFAAIAAPKGRPPKPPAVNSPSGLSATAVSSSQIDLTWQDNSDNEHGFKIERGLDGENFSEIDEVAENITSYSDTGLDAATTYYYRVRAFEQKNRNRIDYSDYSNVASDTTFTLNTLPDAPTNLNAETIVATTTIYIWLDWQDNSDNEDGFSVERSVNGIDFSEIVTTSENVYWYTDYNVATGTTYYYQVRAFNEVGYSGYTNVASATTP
jgi:hypothetical protein